MNTIVSERVYDLLKDL